MSEAIHTGPVTPRELVELSMGLPPEIAGRIRRAADQLAATECTPSGAGRIYSERLRHIREEGYHFDRDDTYTTGQLAAAAACYALPPADDRRQGAIVFGGAPDRWPWSASAWKPGRIVDAGDNLAGMLIVDRTRELEKAGALCAAEIDRLVRLQATGREIV